MNEILGFVNEKTKVLVILKENQLQIDGKSICPLNQQITQTPILQTCV